MTVRHRIRINNTASIKKTYNLFSAKPKIVGEFTGNVWQNVITTISVYPGSWWNIEINLPYFAICGKFPNSLGHGQQVEVTQNSGVPIGASPEFGVREEAEELYFTNDYGPSGVQIPAIQFHSNAGSFTEQDAINARYFVGLAESVRGTIVPVATFIPKPGVAYQIHPITTYYLTCGDLETNSLIDAGQLSSPVCEIDFSKYSSGSVVVTDENIGKFNLREGVQ